VRRHWVLKGLAFVVLCAAVLAVVSFVVMTLWNDLIPRLFAGPVVTFWQAAGLLVLSRLLVGGLRGRGGHGWRHRAWHRRWDRMTPEERERFREGFKRWRHMSSEERAQFRARYGGCGGFGAQAKTTGPGESAAPLEGAQGEAK
jgi:Protein of unknown function (DUF3106)